jgi:glycerate kinase
MPFASHLKAITVATAIANGLRDGGLPEPDVYPLGDLAADFDTRMRAAKAVVIAAPSLDQQTLVGSLPFEIATRARQAGVPCYAIARENELDLFDARILDLQVVLQAGSAAALRKAGQALAKIV